MLDTLESDVSLIIRNSLKPIGDAVSDILNCICPQCGGKMGGLGIEFKCQGRCRTDWRELWDSVRGPYHAS
jgi:hypothetical protein